jgi:hypothetical protein
VATAFGVKKGDFEDGIMSTLEIVSLRRTQTSHTHPLQCHSGFPLLRELSFVAIFMHFLPICVRTEAI